MGLFGINMPTLYGEGRKAFPRLQLEISSKIDDKSIFAREVSGVQLLGPIERYGLLAHSPTWFRDCHDVFEFSFDSDRSPHSITSKGLRVELLVPERPADRPGEQNFFAPLNCAKPLRKQGYEEDSRIRLGLRIIQIEYWDRHKVTHHQRALIHENLGPSSEGFTKMVIFFKYTSRLGNSQATATAIQ